MLCPCHTPLQRGVTGQGVVTRLLPAEHDEQQALKVATDYLSAGLSNPMATGTQFTCLTDQSVHAHVLHQGAQRYTLLISTLPFHQRHLEVSGFNNPA